MRKKRPSVRKAAVVKTENKPGAVQEASNSIATTPSKDENNRNHCCPV
jgi:hypothetical protein